MLKILIVDDEMIYRQHIESLINDENRRGIIGFATNGKHALEQYDLLRPDVVISDVKMPVMNGIEMSRKLQDINPDVNIILLTAYGEIDYAIQAVGCNIRKYFLKHKLSEKSLNDELEKINAEITRNQCTGLKHLCVYKEVNFNTFFTQNSLSVFYLDVNEDNIYSKIELDLKRQEVFYYINKESNLLLLVSSMEYSQCIEHVNNVLHKIKQSHSFQFYAAGTSIVHGDINKKYSHVLAELFDKVTLGIVGEKIKSMDKYIDDNALEYLSDKHVMKLASIIKHYLYLSMDIVDAEFIIIKFYWVVLDYCKSNLLDESRIFGNDINSILSNVKECIKNNDLKKITQNLMQICMNFEQELFLSEYNFYHKKTKQALNIVHRHYMEKITLDHIAQELDISKGYFCNVFKKDMGKSFIEYLTMYRIKTAKTLLSETDKKIYEISQLVGYDNYQYFSLLFKKTVKMWPVEYRKISRK